MATNLRPFEVDDFVVLSDGRIGHVTGIISDKFEVVINENNRELIHFDLDCHALNDIELTIKTIRKPRKGNAESRAIVAMLASEYRQYLNNKLRAHLKFKAAIPEIKKACYNDKSFILYMKAKAMLSNNHA